MGAPGIATRSKGRGIATRSKGRYYGGSWQMEMLGQKSSLSGGASEVESSGEDGLVGEHDNS